MPENAFEHHAVAPNSPGQRHYAVIPSDTEPLPRVPRVLYCETPGTVAVVDKYGSELPYTLVQGQILLFSGVQIKATGTTATVYGWE